MVAYKNYSFKFKIINNSIILGNLNVNILLLNLQISKYLKNFFLKKDILLTKNTFNIQSSILYLNLNLFYFNRRIKKIKKKSKIKRINFKKRK